MVHQLLLQWYWSIVVTMNVTLAYLTKGLLYDTVLYYFWNLNWVFYYMYVHRQWLELLLMLMLLLYNVLAFYVYIYLWWQIFLDTPTIEYTHLTNAPFTIYVQIFGFTPDLYCMQIFLGIFIFLYVPFCLCVYSFYQTLVCMCAHKSLWKKHHNAQGSTKRGDFAHLFLFWCSKKNDNFSNAFTSLCG